MFRTLFEIAVNRGLTGEHDYIRCAQCGLIYGVAEGGRPRQDVGIPYRAQDWARDRARTTGAGVDRTPPEFCCPGCGRVGPLVQGEQVAADTAVQCRRRWICRYRWSVPAAMAEVVCPRCATPQPRPAQLNPARAARPRQPGRVSGRWA